MSRVTRTYRMATYQQYNILRCPSMAEPTRIQPRRACKRPAHHMYSEVEDPDEEESLLQPASSRAAQTSTPKAEITGTGTGADRNVWKHLGNDMVDVILSHLPVYKLWETVMTVSPDRWTEIVTSPHLLSPDGMLGHAKHVESSIGYVTTFTALSQYYHKNYLHQNESHPSPLRVLEHETNTWRSLPAYPDSSVKYPIQVRGVCDGILYLARYSADRNQSGVIVGSSIRREIGLWNPLSHSLKWLPPSPLTLTPPGPQHESLMSLVALVVDTDRRGYKVVEFVSKRVNVRRAGADFAVTGYVVYDSSTSSWGASRPVFLGADPRNTHVSCEGQLCFATAEVNQAANAPPKGLAFYNPTSDVWKEVLFPPSFFAYLRGRHEGQTSFDVNSLLYASGKVFVIMHVCRLRSLGPFSYEVLSVDMADIPSGFAAFQHVTRVRQEGAARTGRRYGYGYSTKQGRHCDRDDVHPKPILSRNRNEITLKRLCVCVCANRWYTCTIGGRVYLCTVVCGKWHRRFDIAAGEWTRFQMEIPADELQPRLRPGWQPLYLPYTPTWVKV